MKKGRAGVLLTVLCAPTRVAEVEAVMFTHGGTIGIRRERIERHKLIRIPHRVETSLGSVQGKCVWLPEGKWRFTVEHDDAVTVAMAHGKSLREVRDLAALAFDSEEPPPAPRSNQPR